MIKNWLDGKLWLESYLRKNGLWQSQAMKMMVQMVQTEPSNSQVMAWFTPSYASPPHYLLLFFLWIHPPKVVQKIHSGIYLVKIVISW